MTNPLQIPDAAVQEHKPTLIEVLNEMKCRLESPPEPDLVELRIMCNAAIATLVNEGTKPVDVAVVREGVNEKEEFEIDKLRFRAFHTNSVADRQAYFDAVSKWFQDRHYRRMDAECALSAEPAQGEQLPQDIINLIIAAREFWDDHNDLSPESDALDKALMPFASLVPYGNDPDEEKL